ncbi:hypothetical protein PSR1_03844 [Anaeromyxobacter sp. PSR-1]|nr:hypothetical protein PSR1_03844 [Anaeromyxobacter sp. PSR-1]
MRRVASASRRASFSTFSFFGSLPSADASMSRSIRTKTCAWATAASLRPMRPAQVTMRDWKNGASTESGFSWIMRW